MIRFARGPALLAVATLIVLAAGNVNAAGKPDTLYNPASQRLSLPPRNIDDIKEALNRSPDGSEDLSQARQTVTLVPPSSTDPHALASFYWTRGRAALQLGLMNQAVEDLRLAARYSKGLDTRDVEGHRIWAELAQAEQRAGNLQKALVAREHAIDQLGGGNKYMGLQMGMRQANARIHLKLGNVEKARALLEEVESRLTTARNLRNWRWLQHNWIVHAADIRAELLEYEGRYAEAEPLRRFALENRIKDFNINPEREAAGVTKTSRQVLLFNIARAVNALAENLIRQQRYAEAEAIVRSELFRVLRVRGRYWEGTANSLTKLAKILNEQGRFAEARELAGLAIDIHEKTRMPPTAVLYNNSRRMRAIALSAENRPGEAVSEFERVEKTLAGDAVAQRVVGKEHPEWAISLVRTGRATEALPMLEKLLARRRERFGDKHHSTLGVRGLYAMALAAAGRRDEALRTYAEVLPPLRAAGGSTNGTLRSPTQIRRYRLIVESYLDLLVDLRATPGVTVAGRPVLSEAFRMADQLHARGVQQALTSGAARTAATEPGLAELVNREQGAARQLQEAYLLLTNLYAAPPEERGPDAVKRLRQVIARASKERQAIYADIERRYPRYAELLNPSPASIEAVRASLTDTEVLVMFFTTDARTYVWAVPRQGEIGFAVAPLGRNEIARRVTSLRKALDPGVASINAMPAFDLSTAHGLYRDFLQPVESVWQGKKTLLVVSHGALGQLPIALLPTEPTVLAPDRERLFDAYRQVPWLARRVAVGQLPSAKGLVTLRALPTADPTRLAFAGFGDPVFNREQLAAGETASAPLATRRLSLRNLRVERVRNDSAGEANTNTNTTNSSTLAQVSRLPDTADEIREIAGVLRADTGRDVFLRLQATEDNVRKTNLLNRRIIMFATHGLVPGELDGLEQPALALTQPQLAGGTGDGLLTMSDVLGLRLNADWVVLSACNTASGDKDGAEAVSGLGRAFFYAGTRALLVTHWPVETTSARRLTTDLFRRIAATPGINRAEALRATMIAVMDGPGYTDPVSGKELYTYAHPIFWAPYALVGDSGR